MKEFEKINNTIIFSTFYILGVVSFFTGTVVWLAGFLLLILIFLLYKKLVSNKAAIVFYLAFAFALVNCHFQIKDFDGLSKFIPSNAVLTGTVATIPTTNIPVKTKFYLRVDSGIFNGQKAENLKAKTIVTLYDTPENIAKIKIADKVELKGKLRNPLRAKNPSQFDYANYLKNHGAFSTFYVKNSEWKILSAPDTLSGRFLQKLNDKRTKIFNLHSTYLKTPNLEVLGGIVFGDDAINPPDYIKASFINSGLFHILAASGMNVSIIFGIWFFIGTRLKLSYRLVIFVGALLVAFYTLMTGMGPSVLRAAIMIEFVLFGKLINRSADSIALVFFVAFLMLLYNPAMINDVGFQLSFVVTFALMYFCPPILGKIENKLLEFCAGAVMIPLVAQLFAAPIQMFYFNTFATYSVLANFAITPFIMTISFLGFVASILAMIPIDFVAQNSCMIFDAVLNPVVTILVRISDYFSSMPNSLLTTFHPTHLQIILYYGVLLMFGLAIRRGFKNKKILISILVLFLLFFISFVKIEPKNCEILVFDVGNADSFLIKTPEKKYILIDTAHGFYEGSKSTFSQANSIIVKYLADKGIKKIDLMILTHFDADHSGGAVDVMKAVKVDKVILNKDKDDSKVTKYILNYIKQNDIKSVEAKNNENVVKEKDFVLKTLTPDFLSEEKNDNDNSIITLLSYGDFDMLFMADGGVKTFNRVQKDLDKTDIEILKSGHHGARNTVNNKMLKSIKPDVAIISTGYNSYGHPTKSTLKTLAKNNVRILRTDTNNAIKITVQKDRYKLFKYNCEKRGFSSIIEKYSR